MADIETVVKGVVAPLTTTITSTRVVRDAWKLALRPEDEYIESQVALEKLEFATSALGGLGAAAAPPAAGSVRSTSTVTVPLADSAGGSDSAALTVTLYGSGDVRGLDRAQIIRRYPTPGSTTAEETVLAHVEFDRPELPWAFSPAPQPGQPIKPWLALIVVPRMLVEWEPAAAGTAKAAWNFTVKPCADGTTELRTETRVLCADAATRRRFRTYWTLVAPFSGLIRREMLAAFRSAAESAPDASGH